MTNEQLTARIQGGEDVSDNMAALWEQNRGFIAKMAIKYQGVAEFDDLMQEGYLGLCQAVDNYKPDTGANFLSYAKPCISHAMINYIQNNGTVRIPIVLHSQVAKYEKVRNAFLSQIGREPEKREISYYLGVDEKSIKGIKKAARMRDISSLDSPIAGADDLTVNDTIPSAEDVEHEVLEELHQERLTCTLWECVSELPGHMPEVIRRHYQNREKLQDIGRSLGLPVGKANSLKHEAVRRLRRNRELSIWAEDYIDTHAYSGSVGSFNRTWTSSTERAALGLLERF